MDLVQPIEFARFKAEFLSLYQSPARAPTTLCAMKRVLRELEELPMVGTTADLVPETIAAWLATRPKSSPNTLVGLLGNIKAACNYAVDRGYLARSPFRRGRPFVRAEEPQRERHHPIAAIGKVLEHLRGRRESSWEVHRLYALAALVAHCGLRKTEALTLKVEDVDIAGRMVHISPRQRRKTAKSARPVPMPAELAPILREWIGRCGGRWQWLFPCSKKDAPWTSGGPGRKPVHQLAAAGRAAGVEGFTFLSLRHSWATHAEYWGFGPAAIERVMGHTSQQTQRRYRHADAKNLVALVASVRFPGEPPAATPEAAGRGQIPALEAPWLSPPIYAGALLP